MRDLQPGTETELSENQRGKRPARTDNGDVPARSSSASSSSSHRTRRGSLPDALEQFRRFYENQPGRHNPNANASTLRHVTPEAPLPMIDFGETQISSSIDDSLQSQGYPLVSPSYRRHSGGPRSLPPLPPSRRHHRSRSDSSI